MTHSNAPHSAPTEPPTLLQLFFVFSRIGLTSFGGGLSGWLYREFVQDRPWIGEEEFLNGLSLSQALPGVNVTNMGIWIGYRLLGLRGAVVAVTGIVVPPAFVIIGIAALFVWLSRFPLTRFGLDGAAAAAIGLSLSMGIAVARRVPRRASPVIVMIATLLAVGWFHWPLPWVVLVAGSVSVALEYLRLSRG